MPLYPGSEPRAGGTYVHPNHTGDVASVGDGATTIQPGVVNNTKLATVPTQTFKARSAAGLGAPEDLPIATVQAMLGITAGGGLDIASVGPSLVLNGTELERAALTGDVTAPQDSNATAIANNAVSNAKLADMLTGTMKGRIAGSTGDPEDLTAAQARTLLNVADGATAYIHPNHSGDVTSVGEGAQTIALNAVSNAKLADMATGLIKGRATALTGDPEDLTAAQVRTILNVADGATAYVHPNHSGDVTSVGSGAQTIALNAVGNTKLADMPTLTFKGRVTAATGDPEDLTVAQMQAALGVGGGGIAIGSVGPSLVMNATELERAALIGDVTAGQDSNITAIATGVVSNAKLGTMPATTLKGNSTAGVASPTDLTATQARALLNVADGANNYSHPNHSGDVTSVGSGAQTIVDGVVTYAKMQAVSAAQRLLGRGLTAGAPEELTVGASLVFGSTSRLDRSALTGDVTAAANSNATTIAANVVNNTKLADVPTATMKGRVTAATGDPEDLTVAQVQTLLNIVYPPIASEIEAGLVEHATQAEMEAATDVQRAVTPYKQLYHPSVFKAWCVAASTGAAQRSFNVTSVVDMAVGEVGINFSVTFGSAAYLCFTSMQTILPTTLALHKTVITHYGSVTATDTRKDFICHNAATPPAALDPSYYHLGFVGDLV